LVSVPQWQKRSGCPMEDAPVAKAQSRREDIQVLRSSSVRTHQPITKIFGNSHLESQRCITVSPAALPSGSCLSVLLLVTAASLRHHTGPGLCAEQLRRKVVAVASEL
jgi:hypothetical protein